MSKKIFSILLFYCCIYSTFSRFFKCPETSSPPQDFGNPNYSFEQVTFRDVQLNPVTLSGQILVNTHDNFKESTQGYLIDSQYCPQGFKIIKKDELVTIISDLGNKAYSTFTDPNGLDMSNGIYYNTNTKGAGAYNKIFMIIRNNEITFEDFDPSSYITNPSSTTKFHTICKLYIPDTEIVFPDNKRDFDYDTQLELNINGIEYFTDFIWRINGQIIKDRTAIIPLTESGVSNVEFWGKFVTGTLKYLCDIFYVGKAKVSNEQKFTSSKIKKIRTNFQLNYNPSLHFTTSNCPVAPRDDGGYYIAVPDKDKYLHILSFDKNDNLLKDFDTKEKARPHDITTTYLGFAVYCVDANNRDHSYITVYNKDFAQVKRVQVMNNVNTKENQRIDSTPDKQLIRYNNKGRPHWGFRFIYQADNAKLVYSRGRIVLIFAHYNIFDDDYKGHNADTVATFNDNLEDIDYGVIFGASHSLIQSLTFDDNYYWTATLSDGFPQGIRVQYISKRDFQNNYDAVFKKHNLRICGANSDLGGYIKGYSIGWADGKLGAILYFEELELYCLVYAKTPDYTEGEKYGKAVIYMTTWKFYNGEILDITVKEIKIFETGNVMQVRAGKYGNDKVIITYLGTTRSGHNYYGNIPMGSSPNIFVVKLPDFSFIINDEKMDDLLMNTNEDLRTFSNGILIWATSDSSNYLVINKIGIGDTYDIIPSIIWKDIFKLNMEGTKTINNKEIHGATINLRGISSSIIINKHTFTIYLSFQINSSLRNLEGESELKLPAICQVVESDDETGEEFQILDYECICEQPSGISLSNYKLTNIEEGNNKDSLKTSNLNELVSDKKKNNANLQYLTTVTQSEYTEEDFNRIAVFKFDKKISRINAEEYKFNFKISGNLNKDITPTTINRDFELYEIDTKANCKFEIGDNKVASLSCELNVENYTNIEEFSFKTSEIFTENNEIYLSQFNDIILTNSKTQKDNDDDRSWVIPVSVVCAVICGIGIGIGVYLIFRKIRLNKTKSETEVDIKSKGQTNEVVDDIKSSDRVVNYKN